MITQTKCYWYIVKCLKDAEGSILGGDGFTLAHRKKNCSPFLSLYWMTALHLKGYFHIPITAQFYLQEQQCYFAQ